jgi:hypothetical protein
MKAAGSVDLAAYSPHVHFSATVSGFPWGGGLLSAGGQFHTSGIGLDSLTNLRASGSFLGRDVSLSTADAFSRVSGLFDFSFADGWPNLRLSKLQATQDEDDWTGEAASRSDGKLVVDLENGGRQRHVVSALVPENITAPAALASQAVSH